MAKVMIVLFFFIKKSRILLSTEYGNAGKCYHYSDNVNFLPSRRG
nr:MAG TPA: hypothetical protein [Caudoviricetes sp.]